MIGLILLGFIFFWGFVLARVIDSAGQRPRLACAAEIRQLDLLRDKLAARQSGNAQLSSQLEDIFAVYEAAKDICRSLDENKVYENFCRQAGKYIGLADCRLIRDREELARYRADTVFSIDVNNQQIGALIAAGIDSQKTRDKFYILFQQLVSGLRRSVLYKRVQELAIVDSLTGVFSRRYAQGRLGEELQRSMKFRHSVSVLMIDLDNFKSYNDQYGHLVGDAILKDAAGTIKENIRQIDLIGRFGGEEFIGILAETDALGALLVAERIRRAVEEKKLKIYDESLRMTLSIGIASFPAHGQDSGTLIDKADKALYAAKNSGRNRSVIFQIA